jgi:hypothetical protein
MKNVLWSCLAAALALGAYASPASASLVYTLNAGAFSPGPFGTVTLSQDGTNTVKVEVVLATGVGFVDTGAGEPLLFNITGNPTITISNLTTPFGIGTTASGGSIHTGGAGDFEYDIVCGTACGTGGNAPNRGPLDFDVTATGLTVNSFDSNGTAFFAADICRDINTDDRCVSGNNTGVVYAGGPPTTTDVPEPATLLIFGVGLVGIGVMRRRAA